MTLGEDISIALSNIENILLDNNGIKPNFTDEGVRAGIYIFQSVLMDKMFELQMEEKIPLSISCDMAEKCGLEIREIVKKYCNIDTHQLYKI